MNGMPIMYGQEMAMNYFQLQPSWVKGRANAAVETEKRYLYNRLYSVYNIKIPDQWPLNYFRFFVFRFGSLGAIYTKEFGWMAQPYGVTKLNPYFQPAVITVWNQFLRTEKTGVIGVNAEIIRCMDDYYGLDDLVTKYAEMLAQIDKSLNVSLMNANVSLLAQAKTKNDAQDIKDAYAKASTGEPLVVVNKSLFEEGNLKTMIDSPKTQYIGLELEQTRRDILNQFLTDIGIPNANYDKRAQISSSEVHQSDGETKSICSIILENMQDSFERLNRISGLGCSISLRKEVTEIGKDDAMGDATGTAQPPGRSGAAG